jgi:hypothetical protein
LLCNSVVRLGEVGRGFGRSVACCERPGGRGGAGVVVGVD